MLLSTDYQLDDAVTVFESFNKNEAKAEFDKHYCDCSIAKTNTGYQLTIGYCEMEIQHGEMEDGVFEYYEAEGNSADFDKAMYEYNG